MPDLKFDMGRYEPGDSHIGDQDLNALADALIRQISGGDGIVVRKYGNRITISLDPEARGLPAAPAAVPPPTTNPHVQVGNSGDNFQDLVLVVPAAETARFNFDLTSGLREENTAEVQDATNDDPIVITTKQDHGFETGDLVSVDGVQGNSAANGSWAVEVFSPRIFSLGRSTGNGNYTIGGVARRIGQVNVRLIPAAALQSGGVTLGDQVLGRGTKTVDKLCISSSPTTPNTQFNADFRLALETRTGGLGQQLRLEPRSGSGAVGFSFGDFSALNWYASFGSGNAHVYCHVSASDSAYFAFVCNGTQVLVASKTPGGSGLGTTLDPNITVVTDGYVGALGFMTRSGGTLYTGATETLPVGTQPIYVNGLYVGHT